MTKKKTKQQELGLDVAADGLPEKKKASKAVRSGAGPLSAQSGPPTDMIDS